MDHFFNPKVSIVIPVFNGSNYLRDAIDSALAQTYQNIEIIVVNDGSNDNGKTEDIALSFGEKIKYLHKENGGVASALNFGIKHMTGEYFSWLSHDDLYESEKITYQVEYLGNLSVPKRDNVILFSKYKTLHGSALNEPNNLAPDNSCSFKAWLSFTPLLHGCTLLLPSKIFEIFGGFNVFLKTTQDYSFWIKLTEKYEFIYLDKSLVVGRFHEDQSSKTLEPIAKNEIDYYYFHQLIKLKAEDFSDADSLLMLKKYLSLHETHRKTDYFRSTTILRLLIRKDFVKNDLQYKIKAMKVVSKFVIDNIRPYITIKYLKYYISFLYWKHIKGY